MFAFVYLKQIEAFILDIYDWVCTMFIDMSD